MKTSLKVLLSFLLIIVVIFFILSSNKTKTNFTVYPVVCADWINSQPKNIDFTVCNNLMAMERHTFSIDVPKAEVTESSPDLIDIYKLNNCVIKDESHWSCGKSWTDSVGQTIMAPYEIGKGDSGFFELGLPESIAFVSEAKWNSINNAKPSRICDGKWCGLSAYSTNQ